MIPLPHSYLQLKKKERLRTIDIFRRADVAGDGVVTLDELRQFATSRGLQFERGQLESIMASLDLDGNGVLDLVEFERACSLYDAQEVGEGKRRGSEAEATSEL